MRTLHHWAVCILPDLYIYFEFSALLSFYSIWIDRNLVFDSLLSAILLMLHLSQTLFLPEVFPISSSLMQFYSWSLPFFLLQHKYIIQSTHTHTYTHTQNILMIIRKIMNRWIKTIFVCGESAMLNFKWLMSIEPVN